VEHLQNDVSDSAAALPHIVSLPAADGYPLQVRVWRCAGPARAQVVCLHGVISHSGWYAHSSAFLASKGCEVHFLDRRGSGLNAQRRGDVDSFQTWLDDVENCLDRLRGGAPRILVGISWGGKLAAAVARHRPLLLEGLALLCPGIHARTKASRLQRRLLKLARWAGVSRRRVAIPLQDPALFIDDRRWQEYIASDPLVLREITIRFAAEDLKLDAYVAGAAPHIRTPTLLMLAGRDQIIDNNAVREYFHNLGAVEKKLIEYPQAAHTLEFELDRIPFFSDLADWILGTAARCTTACEEERQARI
jgi:alpha-beta hydrolase superfamily lysophospholipase